MNLKSNVPTYISYPIFSSSIGLILFQIPLLGVLLFLPLSPIAELYDALIPGEFGSTGKHVEIGFAWITFKTWQAWLFYGSFFFLIGLLLGTFTHYRRIKKQAKALMALEVNQPTRGPLKKVTPVLRFLALALFVIMPFVGAWIGYNSTLDTNELTPINAIVDSNEVFYKPVFVSNWDNPTDNFKFLEYLGDLYIFHSYPFDGESVLKKIEGVNKSAQSNSYTFEHIGASYIKNDTYVIFAGEGFNTPTLLINADPSSFSLTTSTTGQIFGIDKKSVYFRGQHLIGIDPTEITIIPSNHYKLGIVHDQNTFWFPEGDCTTGSYRIGTESEVEEFIFPC